MSSLCLIRRIWVRASGMSGTAKGEDDSAFVELVVVVVVVVVGGGTWDSKTAGQRSDAGYDTDPDFASDFGFASGCRRNEAMNPMLS